MPIWWPVGGSHVPSYKCFITAIIINYTFNSLSLFWLAESVQWFFLSRTTKVTVMSCIGLSAGTRKLCIFGHLGLVFISSCFVSHLLFLLYYVICAPVGCMIFKGNYVKFVPFVLLAISEEAKHVFQVCFVDRARHQRKLIVVDKDSQNTKRSTKVAKQLFGWLHEREKSERTWGIFTRLEINYQFQLLSWPFFLSSSL